MLSNKKQMGEPLQKMEGNSLPEKVYNVFYEWITDMRWANLSKAMIGWTDKHKIKRQIGKTHSLQENNVQNISMK